MTVLSVVKDVCAAVGVAVPQSIFSNITGNRTMQEMLSLANEMAQRIAYDTREWTALTVLGSVTGDGVAEQFLLPANFRRLLLMSNVWRSSSPTVPAVFVPGADDWLQLSLGAPGYPKSAWRTFGNSIGFHPILADGETAQFVYLSKNAIILSSGGYGDAFLNDGDTFVLDERLLKLGMIWQWKAQKGSPYAEDMGTYGDALTYAMGHDTPAPIIIGRSVISANAKVAYPWPVPT